MYAQKSELRKAAEIVILVGAILETIGHAVLILFSLGLFGIVSIPILVLLWVARHQAVNRGSRGWAIYGIIHGALSGWITLVGYILLVVDNNRNPQFPSYQDTEQF